MLSDEDRIVLRLVAEDGRRVAARVAEHLGISRQAATGRLARLMERGLIAVSGRGAGTRYTLVTMADQSQRFPLAGLEEDRVWSDFVLPQVRDLPHNVLEIWQYAVTEMVNNAIDHSGGSELFVVLRRDARSTEVMFKDDGEGIFLKIQRALDLADPRLAILELAKGKLTTDPENHTGEGIFFSSKAVDQFMILSGSLSYSHGLCAHDFLLEVPPCEKSPGTLAVMQLANDSPRKLKDVFDQFAMPDEFTFAKTIVPVRLAQYEGELLVSRSQAKRLTARFDRFQTVVLDFSGVTTIGQAFADEVFRVFRNGHPSTELLTLHMTPEVEQMVRRVQRSRD